MAFFSQQFATHHLKLASYERKLIRLVQEVHHWRSYLWGHHFMVRTDHYALKFLLDQRLSMLPQHQWVSKLFGYDFDVEYHLGLLNTIADALSLHGDDDTALIVITGPTFCLFDDIHHEL